MKAILNLLYTNNWLEERLKQILKSEGLTMQQYNILRILRGSGKPLSTMQIRERMIDRMSDTSRIIDRMILKKLVEKNINESDKRLVDIVITQKGINILDKLDERNHEIDGIISALSEEEVVLLNNLLDKIRSN